MCTYCAVVYDDMAAKFRILGFRWVYCVPHTCIPKRFSMLSQRLERERGRERKREREKRERGERGEERKEKERLMDGRSDSIHKIRSQMHFLLTVQMA